MLRSYLKSYYGGKNIVYNKNTSTIHYSIKRLNVLVLKTNDKKIKIIVITLNKQFILFKVTNVSILTYPHHRCGYSDQKNVTDISLKAVKVTIFKIQYYKHSVSKKNADIKSI